MKKKSLLFFVLVSAACSSYFEPRSMTLSGTLELTEHSVGPKVSGKITALNFDEGSPVTKGQVLATLDRYDQAKRDFDRVKMLADQGGASQKDLEEASLALDDQEVTSPIDGRVLLKNHELGETVPAGASIAVIGNDRIPWVRVYIPEGSVNRVDIGQKASLRFDGLKDTFPGHVIYISPRSEFTPRNVQTPEERVTQTFAAKVALDEAAPTLRPGVSTDVTIELKK